MTNLYLLYPKMKQRLHKLQLKSLPLALTTLIVKTVSYQQDHLQLKNINFSIYVLSASGIYEEIIIGHIK